jgi:tetratricopeptide (TPR) repeat protein
MDNLGLFHHVKAQFARAEPLMRRRLAFDEASLGPDHPTVAIRLNNLAELLRATTRLAEAEPLYRRALAIDGPSLGPDHSTVATGLNNLALLLQATNRLAEAEPLYRRALAIEEASLGADHPSVARDLSNLSTLPVLWRKRKTKSIDYVWAFAMLPPNAGEQSLRFLIGQPHDLGQREGLGGTREEEVLGHIIISGVVLRYITITEGVVNSEIAIYDISSSFLVVSMDFISREHEWADKARRFLKAELKRADVTYEELAERLRQHGLEETKHSVSAKIGRGTFPASFFFAAMKAIEREHVNLADV